MPKREDLRKILIIGSGPIQIGQACEFDYSGTQAVRALKAEGYEIILVNSNPATIMTDPELADRTYIEPLTAETLEKIIAIEKPDALLPTLGGQVALNLAIELHEHGVLETYRVEVLGASIPSIELAEDREKFKNLMVELDLPILKSKVINNLSDGVKAADEIGFPLVLRPSFTLGGAGGGIVYNKSELSDRLTEALRASPTSEVLLEESVIGWKEIELEVMRDRKDQMVVVCGIENLDPMGIHTGDSITLAPIQTLTDKEYQRLRESAKKIVRGVGVETGGCNIQYALDPHSDRWIIVEMNPRVSRSSALASKATGFPIAKLAALLAVGYSLDEIKNDITKETPASFEPVIDYIVVKVPRFAFEKFSATEPLLGTQMKSVGEVMSLGRSFKEAFQKAFASLELGNKGLLLPKSWKPEEVKLETIRRQRFDRWWLMAELLRAETATIEEIHEATQIDRWFLKQLEEIIDYEKELARMKFAKVGAKEFRKAKNFGFTDEVLAVLWKTPLEKITAKREKCEVEASLNQVDTCAGEFEAKTPYYYFAYENYPSALPDKIPVKNKKEAVIILGSGPNRIGQGVEFDYCCVKSAQAIRDLGFEAVMVNCNPETVSTDYDISNRLYFEPLQKEFLERIFKEENKFGKIRGVLCQTGGGTALRLSQQLDSKSILGTPSAQIDRAEDRAKFDKVLTKLKLKRPESKTVNRVEDLKKVCANLGYPVLIRPSYVLGGRSMHIVRSEENLNRILQTFSTASDIEFPLLVDRFLDEAIEVDVDCIGDSKAVVVLAVMEHIEEAGIHSGDSSCSLPSLSLSNAMIDKIRKTSIQLGRELQLSGFLNIQFAISKKNELYVLEVNPRASRTLPFVCKATGTDWVRAGIHAMLGKTFKEQELVPPPLYPADFQHYSVKAVVFPFLKFPGVDVLLGPEMKSTGEVMGVGEDFSEAFMKALIASSHRLPKSGSVFVSVRDSDKEKLIEICQKLKALGFRLIATHGTAAYLRKLGIVVAGINKVKEGQPHIVDAIINGQIDMVINTTDSESAISDSYSIRRSALQTGVPYFTTLTAAKAAVHSLPRYIRGELEVRALQSLPFKGKTSTLGTNYGTRTRTNDPRGLRKTSKGTRTNQNGRAAS
ncbi:MAG: carbamoyl-phosphate synthase large subunit [Deltaproteobacteria bacterium]|nr:carbamoyl-phosphate synthase large subunit [Deltaproteobacteria bacterium]